MEYTATVIESQVDYLTVSAHGQASARNLLDLAQGLAKEEKARGGRARHWRLMGYEGTHIGATEYGRRDEYSTILRVSGDAANRVLCRALSVADTVTRVDLAATVRCEPPNPMLGWQAYGEADRFYREDRRRARPSFTGDADEGLTCYVGRRESENFLRIYNKEAECRAQDDDDGVKRYQACWRYELEAKGTVAKPLAELVNDSPDAPRYVQQYLHTWLTSHGISPAFPWIGAQSLVPGFRRRSDADTKLRHIRKNVRPTVNWLREAGHEPELREALGFDLTGDALRQLQGILDRWGDRVGDVPPRKRGTEEAT